jgi:hypothetical protein
MSLVNWRNAAAFHQNMLECFRTFPSVYQLMPPLSFKYLHSSLGLCWNPLEGGCISKEHRDEASAAHAALVDAESILRSAVVPVHTIFTELHGGLTTDLEYRVDGEPSDSRLQLLETLSRTKYGDGTVCRESARGGEECHRRGILNVDHAYLCNSIYVNQILGTIL